MRPFAPHLLSLALLLCAGPAVHAGGKGEGGCVITAKAPMYEAATGDKVVGNADLGDSIVGVTYRGILPPEYLFEEESGRVHITFLPLKEESGMPRSAWMKSTDIARFTFECGCGATRKNRDECTPFAGVFSKVYNACYKEARDKKRAEVLKQGTAAAANPGAKALRNEDILTLVKVGLDDKLIIAKVQGAEATAFDLSTDGLVALKAGKVSNAVIEALMKRAGK